MKFLLIMLLALLDTGRSTHLIYPNPCSYGGATHVPHPTDCAKFLICDRGRPVENNCPPGTLWHDFIKTCDHARNVQCSSRLQQTIVVPENARNVNCPGVVDMRHPVFVPHQDCSKYYLCTPSGPQELTCDPGSSWNINSNRCEWSGQMSALSNSFSSPTLPLPPPIKTTPSTATTPEILPEGCPRVVDPNKPVFLPHSDCSMFNVCTVRGLVAMRCTGGYHWSTTANRCMVPWDAGCVDISAASVTTTTTTTTTEASARRSTTQPTNDGTVSSSSSVTPSLPVDQPTTIVSDSVNATDSETETDDLYSTDVPIFG